MALPTPPPGIVPAAIRAGLGVSYIPTMDARRRELIRQYKDTPPDLGVGVVRNLESGRVLLVAAGSIQALLNRFRAQLRLGAFRNQPELLADWQRLGEDHFEFAVLDTLTPKDEPGYNAAADLEALRQLWQDKLAATTPAWY